MHAFSALRLCVGRRGKTNKFCKLRISASFPPRNFCDRLPPHHSPGGRSHKVSVGLATDVPTYTWGVPTSCIHDSTFNLIEPYPVSLFAWCRFSSDILFQRHCCHHEKKGAKELSQCTSNKRSTRLPRQKDSSYEKEKLLLPRSMQTLFCHSLTGICSKPLLEDLA